MIKEKFNSNLDLKYFISLLLKKKRKFPKSYFFGVKTRKKELEVTPKLCKKIIVNYFDIYFRDFYNKNEVSYFPLSGELVKAKGKGFYKNATTNVYTDSVIWVWYLRPARNYYSNIKIIKMKGSTGKVNRFDKKLQENNEVDVLPYYKDLLKEFNSNDKLFK